MFDRFPESRMIIAIVSLFLAASLSFGVGYLYGKDQSPTPIIIEKN